MFIGTCILQFLLHKLEVVNVTFLPPLCRIIYLTVRLYKTESTANVRGPRKRTYYYKRKTGTKFIYCPIVFIHIYSKLNIL